jgi:hypothetical protein
MSESPEIPEAKDTFERMVAVTIAILAIALSIMTSRGDNAKTHAIIKANQSTDQWGYYQAKGIKKDIFKSQEQLLSAFDSAKAGPGIQKLNAEILRYDKEQDSIKERAERLNEESIAKLEVNERCDIGVLIVQIAIVLSSLAILSRWKLLWVLGMCAGVIGAAIGFSSFFI